MTESEGQAPENEPVGEAEARQCGTPECPWDALAERDYCWDCAHYRSLPKWRQRLNVMRPAGKPFLLVALTSLLWLTSQSGNLRTIIECQPKPACHFDSWFSHTLLLVGVGVFAAYVLWFTYMQFFGRDDIVDPEPPPGP